MAKIFDAHTHFNDALYEKKGHTLEKLIKDAEDHGVGYFLNSAFDVDSSKLALEQAKKAKNMFVAVGIHPMDVHKFSKSALKEIDALAKENKVVAIGEVGLDYYWKKDNREQQREWFKKQIELANKHDLALMMHIRDDRDKYMAYNDALEILRKYPAKRMIVHCFSANKSYAEKFLELGCYINIGGAVTFKNAKELQEAAAHIPLDRLLVETDAPYLTPHPHRGEMNFSRMINYTVDKLAALKKVDRQTIIDKTTANAFKIFNLSVK